MEEEEEKRRMEKENELDDSEFNFSDMDELHLGTRELVEDEEVKVEIVPEADFRSFRRNNTTHIANLKH